MVDRKPIAIAVYMDEDDLNQEPCFTEEDIKKYTESDDWVYKTIIVRGNELQVEYHT